MRCFRVEDGDLKISHSGRLDMVSGQDKLVQDLTHWLLEPLGIGFTTPGFGSTLTMQDPDVGASLYVGRTIDDQALAEIEFEISRVLNLYQQHQMQRIRKARSEGTLARFSRGEILDSIDNIRVTTDVDSVVITIDMTTGSGQTLSMGMSAPSSTAVGY